MTLASHPLRRLLISRLCKGSACPLDFPCINADPLSAIKDACRDEENLGKKTWKASISHAQFERPCLDPYALIPRTDSGPRDLACCRQGLRSCRRGAAIIEIAGCFAF